MNRVSPRRGTGLALAVAYVGVAAAILSTPALADMSEPPARYDIGGVTEEQTLDNFREVFGWDGYPWLIRVPLGQVQAECDAISQHRFGRPYPASETAGGKRLLGCMISYPDRSDPIIVYSVDPNRPWLAGQILRHEIAHLFGWPGDHRRD